MKRRAFNGHVLFSSQTALFLLKFQFKRWKINFSQVTELQLNITICILILELVFGVTLELIVNRYTKQRPFLSVWKYYKGNLGLIWTDKIWKDNIIIFRPCACILPLSHQYSFFQLCLFPIILELTSDTQAFLEKGFPNELKRATSTSYVYIGHLSQMSTKQTAFRVTKPRDPETCVNGE